MKSNTDSSKKRVIGIGASGMVGSRIQELLGDRFLFTNMSLETGLNITDPSTLTPILQAEPSIVLHLAAKADVDGCEQDKPLGEKGAAWKINVEGTRNVAEACKKAGHRMVYVSTDFVFDGENTPDGGYAEHDTPHPINWYAETKYEGEKIVSRLPGSLIVRIAYPYRSSFAEKKDFVRVMLSRLREGELLAVTDHIMTPTFIDDIALGLQRLFEVNDASGTFHVVGSQSLTPFDAAVLVAKTFGVTNPQIVKTTRENFFKGKAPRPYNLTLKNDKIKQLGVQMSTFEEGLQKMSS